MQIDQDSHTERVTLESPDLRILMDPQEGRKIRSLISKRTGIEYLYQDSRSNFGEGQDYGNHDISGFDECFPTVWACDYPDGKKQGLALRDHGYLWHRPWTARIENDRVVMQCDIPELDCRFERVCWLETSRSFRLDYRITNNDDEPLKYVYSAHPLLAANEDTQLVLPQEMDQAFVFFVANMPGMSPGTWIDWREDTIPSLQSPFTAERQACLKVYSPRLTSVRAAVIHSDHKEGLQFDVDADQLPYLGVLYQQGYDSDPEGVFSREVFLALEPTSGVGDDLPPCQTPGPLCQLQPNETKEFTIRLTLINQ